MASTHRLGRKAGLRTIALFEAGKGLLVLSVGFGLLSLIHRQVQDKAEELVRHFHLNPASHIPRIFLQLSSDLTDTRLLLLVASAALYACFRFAEAYGLWNDRRWAKWLGVISGSVYLPIEGYELTKGFSWATCIVLFVNLSIVTYLISTMPHSADLNPGAARKDG
jgi:uncharacterized membrane protein (DUF2068 family)